MTQFATAAELETHLGRTFDLADQARADQALALASAKVQRWCNRVSLTSVPGDVKVLPGVYGPELELPGGPVVSVASVAIDGQAVTGYKVIGDRLVWPRSAFFDQPGTVGSHWGGTDALVTVTYTHGYTIVPDEVKAVVLDIAGRSFTNPTGEKSETLDGYSVVHGAAAGVAVGRGVEMAVLADYHRSTYSTVSS